MKVDWAEIFTPNTRCKYCHQTIYGKTDYWHYWDVATRNFLCTSIKTINHPFLPPTVKPGIWRRLWICLTNS